MLRLLCCVVMAMHFTVAVVAYRFGDFRGVDTAITPVRWRHLAFVFQAPVSGSTMDVRMAEFETMLRSVLWHRSYSSADVGLVVHMMVCAKARVLVNELLQKAAISEVDCLKLVMRDVGPDNKLVDDFNKVTPIRVTHHSGMASLGKIFLPLLPLFSNVSRLLVLDTDMMMLDDIGNLYHDADALLDSKPSALWAMTGAPMEGCRPKAVTEPRTYNKDAYFMASHIYYDLERIRALDFLSLLHKSWTSIGSRTGIAKLADQDLFNSVSLRMPHYVALLHCEWNVWMEFDSKLRATTNNTCIAIRSLVPGPPETSRLSLLCARSRAKGRCTLPSLYQWLARDSVVVVCFLSAKIPTLWAWCRSDNTLL